MEQANDADMARVQIADRSQQTTFWDDLAQFGRLGADYIVEFQFVQNGGHLS